MGGNKHVPKLLPGHTEGARFFGTCEVITTKAWRAIAATATAVDPAVIARAIAKIDPMTGRHEEDPAVDGRRRDGHSAHTTTARLVPYLGELACASVCVVHSFA